MVIRINKGGIRNTLIRLLLISIFFDAYSILYIGSYPVTMFTICAILMFLYSILNFKATFKHVPDSALVCIVLFMVYILFNMFFTVNNINIQRINVDSAMLSTFFFVLFACSFRNVSKNVFLRNIEFFQNLINIMAWYGIYQIIGQIVGLPTDLWLEGHMVEGYNWTREGTSMISSLSIHRAHAFFSEPSTFSQFLALNILIYLVRYSRKNNKKIVLNGVALICSFSGTGILLLLAGLLYFVLVSHNKRLRRIGIYSIMVGLLGSLLIYIFANDIYLVFIYRVGELFSGAGNTGIKQAGWTTSSGFVRFIGIWKILFCALKLHPFIGIGIGKGNEFISFLNLGMRYTMDNGFVEVLTELGLIGFFLYLLVYLSSFKYRKNDYMKLLMFLMIALHFLNNTFSANYYWGLMIFFNLACDINE